MSYDSFSKLPHIHGTELRLLTDVEGGDYVCNKLLVAWLRVLKTTLVKYRVVNTACSGLPPTIFYIPINIS